MNFRESKKDIFINNDIDKKDSDKISLVSHITEIFWNDNWQYGDYSKIHNSPVKLYHLNIADKKNKIICVNAGHGTVGGEKVMTYCHPDKSPKYVSGSTTKGQVYAAAVSNGMIFQDGMPEAEVNLSLALILKEELLKAGYDVLMIRESDDCQSDNIARTVFANNNADCHIALHYDCSNMDKGLFYISVPDIEEYKNMEPVKSLWQIHNKLGEDLYFGAKISGVKVYEKKDYPNDLTQTSYSTIPTVVLEVGDRKSDYSYTAQKKIALGISHGLDLFFETLES